MIRWARLAGAALALAVMLTFAPTASADLDQLLATCEAKDALDDNNANGRGLPFQFCDDTEPEGSGGTVANETQADTVQVPAAYVDAGDPLKDTSTAMTTPGADSNGDISLDADLSLPDPAKFAPPAGGYPLVVMMHGCCSGSKKSWESATIDGGGPENWHYNNAWFASRGYAVLNYTARGFVDGNNNGSTGETQLDSNRFEINDYQHLAGQLADVTDLNPETPEAETVDPSRIVPTGGSYGGGFSWLALTDPTWMSPDGEEMNVVAVGTKYGWTNLVESLVPNGADRRDGLPDTDPAAAAEPLGFPKKSIVAGLYGSGKGILPPGGRHTTFPKEIDDAIICLESTDPYPSNPLCNGTTPGTTDTLGVTLPRFINERSAYYQNDFFTDLANGDIDPVPVYSAGAFSDQLFTASEHRRMVERLKDASPGYPVQEHYGDYNHFVQNKRKEWADVCGADRHVCGPADYPDGDFNADPLGRVRYGVTTRLNRFIDHYAKPQGNDTQAAPSLNVTATLQVCQNGADYGVPNDEPGPRFTADTFAGLAPESFVPVMDTGTQPLTSATGTDPHATNADPVTNSADNGGSCPVEQSPGGAPGAGPGVATYDSELLMEDKTMVGLTRATVSLDGAAAGLQLNVRLYDLDPVGGEQVLVDRGAKVLEGPHAQTILDLHGNGWRFQAGHQIRIELTQNDDPYIKASAFPSPTLAAEGVTLAVPVRPEGAAAADDETTPANSSGGTGAGSGSGGPAYPLPGDPAYPLPGSRPRVDVRSPRLASDERGDRRFTISIRTGAGTVRSNVAGYQLQIRDTSVFQASVSRRVRVRASQSRNVTTFRFRGRANRTYRVRARGFDRFRRFGAWDGSITTVPLDLGPVRTPGVTFTPGWGRPRSGRAYGGRLRRAKRRGRGARFRFRGDRLYIVGRTGPRGGKAQVTLNGRRRTIGFYSRRTRNRRVVAAMRARRRGVNRARIVVLGRKGARNGRGTRVELDALGFRRP